MKSRWATVSLAATLICGSLAEAQEQVPPLPEFAISDMRPDLALSLAALCQLAVGDLRMPDGVAVEKQPRDLSTQWGAPAGRFQCADISLVQERPIYSDVEVYREVGVVVKVAALDGRVALANVIAETISDPQFVLIKRAFAKPVSPKGHLFRFFVLPVNSDFSFDELAGLSFEELVTVLGSFAADAGTAPNSGGQSVILAIDMARQLSETPLPEFTSDKTHAIDSRRSWSLDGWHVAAISGQFAFGDTGSPLLLKTGNDGTLRIFP